MEIFKDHRQVMKAICIAYFYNRDNEDLIETLEQVKFRLSKKEYVLPRDDADIICSILYYLYGDYGTSPRYGWFDNKLLIDEFKNVIDSVIEDLDLEDLDLEEVTK